MSNFTAAYLRCPDPNVRLQHVMIAFTSSQNFIHKNNLLSKSIHKKPNILIVFILKLVFTTCQLFDISLKQYVLFYSHVPLIFFLFSYHTFYSSFEPKSNSFRINTYIKYTGLYQLFPILFYNLHYIGRDS